MDDELRRLFLREMLEQQRPPLPDLVGQVVTRGRHIRRMRRMTAAASITVAAVTVGVLVARPAADAEPAQPITAGGTPAVATAEAGLRSTTSARAVRVPATAEALEELLIRSLPEGTTGEYAVLEDTARGSTTGPTPAATGLAPGPTDVREELVQAVQLRLDTEDGSALISVRLSTLRGEIAKCRPAERSGSDPTCRTLPDGCIVRRLPPDGTGSAIRFAVTRPNRTVVAIGMRVLPGPSGQPAGAGPVGLNELIRIAQDDRLSPEMDPALVEAAARRFPSSLPTVS